MSSAAGNVLVDNVKKWRARTTIANDLLCVPSCVRADGWNDGPRVDVHPTIRPGTHKMPLPEYSRALNGSLHLHLGVVCPQVFFSLVSTESALECLKMDWSTSVKIHSSFFPKKTIFAQWQFR